MKREKKKESYSIVFRSRIKELRGNETQEQFAGSLGVSLDAVKNWEQGYAMPGIDTLFKLCDKYHCEIDYLLGRMEHKTHDLQYICDETGLSEPAVKDLIAHKNFQAIAMVFNDAGHPDSNSYSYGETISRIIESHVFEQIVRDLAEAEKAYKASTDTHAVKLVDHYEAEKTINLAGGIVLEGSAAADFYARHAADELYNVLKKIVGSANAGPA